MIWLGIAIGAVAVLVLEAIGAIALFIRFTMKAPKDLP